MRIVPATPGTTGRSMMRCADIGHADAAVAGM
jgi:hypothetical protein